MAEWTDTTELAVVAGTDLVRGPWGNAVVDNLEWLYAVPMLALRLTQNQEIPSATNTMIDYGERTWGREDMWDDQSPSVVVLPRTGLWLVSSRIRMEGETGDATTRGQFVFANGSETYRFGERSAATNPTEFGMVEPTSFLANDWFEIGVRQLSGGPLNLEPWRTRLIVFYLGPWQADEEEPA